MENSDKLQKLTEELQALTKAIEQMNAVMRLQSLIEEAKSLTGKVKQQPESPQQVTPSAQKETGKNESVENTALPLKEALEALSDAGTSKMEGEKKLFLLHRPTKDNEYSVSKRENNEYETMDESEWMADIEEARNKQMEKNPVVSVWVPQDSITSIPTGKPNMGAWQGLGSNPYIKEFRILIKPGKYQLYQEFKK